MGVRGQAIQSSHLVENTGLFRSADIKMSGTVQDKSGGIGHCLLSWYVIDDESINVYNT